MSDNNKTYYIKALLEEKTFVEEVVLVKVDGNSKEQAKEKAYDYLYDNIYDVLYTTDQDFESDVYFIDDLEIEDFRALEGEFEVVEVGDE